MQRSLDKSLRYPETLSSILLKLMTTMRNALIFKQSVYWSRLITLASAKVRAVWDN